MDRKIEFEKLRNTRDLGGQKTADGRTVVSGRLYRSGALDEATPADAARLKDMIDTVIDLRTNNECSERPDIKIPGVKYVFSPILEGIDAGVAHDKKSREASPFVKMSADPVTAVEHMANTYRNFVKNDFSLRHYTIAIRLLLEPHEKGILWHCTAGKDRAGTTTAIIEEILGVPREEIMANYLRTAEYISKEIVAISEFFMERIGEGANKEALLRFFGTEPEYLHAFWEAMDEKYGGFDGFVREGLGLLDEEVEKIRSTYLA